MRYRNSDVYHRVFPHLRNPATGATLELGPGEEVELPVEIHDTVLERITVKKGRTETPATEPAFNPSPLTTKEDPA